MCVCVLGGDGGDVHAPAPSEHIPAVGSLSAGVIWPGCNLGSPGMPVSGIPQQGSGYRFR